MKADIQAVTDRLGSLPIKEKVVDASSKVLSGKAFLEIIWEVLRNEHDLVMLPPRKKAKV